MRNQFDDGEFKTASACATCKTCVAVAHRDDSIGIRDTKDPRKVTLQFNKAEWDAFVAGVKRGEFDF